MSSDITTLMQQVYDYFLRLFQQRSGSALENTFLSFEPIGTFITPDMFKLHPTDTTYSPVLAVEQFSSLVNTIPDTSGGVFHRTDKLVDDFYEVLLVGSLPIDNNNTLFTTIKAQAVQRFEPTMGSLLKPLVRFHPSYAIPNDWYDPSINDNWATYTFSSGQSNTTSTSGNVPPLILHPIYPFQPWTWRVLPEAAKPALGNQQQLTQFMVESERTLSPNSGVRSSTTVHISPALLELAGMTQMNPIVETETTTHVPLQTVEESTLATSTTAVEAGAAAAPNHIVILQPGVLETELTPLIIRFTSTQPVVSSILSVTFKYCLITIDRPWFSQAFLSMLGWYVPEYQASGFSTGTIENNTGVFPVLPVAYLVIKDLQITGRWTEEDTMAIQRAAAFGPFSLIGRTVDTTSMTLNTRGMQVIGWICQIMPIMPPASAPSRL